MSDKTEWQKTAQANAMQVLADRNAELMERIKELTAAAEVGMQSPVTFMHTEDEMRLELNATIERCAQVAEETMNELDGSLTGKHIAAAIRALKDKPTL